MINHDRFTWALITHSSLIPTTTYDSKSFYNTADILVSMMHATSTYGGWFSYLLSLLRILYKLEKWSSTYLYPSHLQFHDFSYLLAVYSNMTISTYVYYSQRLKLHIWMAVVFQGKNSMELSYWVSYWSLLLIHYQSLLEMFLCGVILPLYYADCRLQQSS